MPQAPTTEAPALSTDDAAVKKYLQAQSVTVLYKYGEVSRKHVGFLGGEGGRLIKFIGGVAKSVPTATAKVWFTGTLSDGKPAPEKPPVIILPTSATEEDYARLTGIPLESLEPERVAAIIMGMNVRDMVQQIGRNDAQALAEALLKELGIQYSLSFAGAASR